jgi:hypothetical protein
VLGMLIRALTNRHRVMNKRVDLFIKSKHRERNATYIHTTHKDVCTTVHAYLNGICVRHVRES